MDPCRHSPVERLLSESEMKKQPGSLPLIMFLSLDEETPRHCINSSNPFHKCADHCFRRGTKSAEDDGKPIEKMTKSCANASNPFHVCADSSCFSHKKALPPPNKERVVVKPKEKSSSNHDRMVHPLCPNASNPFHICVQLCLNKIADKDKPKEDVQRLIIISNKDDQAEKKCDNKDGVQVRERMVHPTCSYASNPFHICVEACFQTTPLKQSTKGGKENVGMAEKIGGLTKCKNASNPFHTCADYCSFQNEPGKDQAKTEKRDKVTKTVEENTIPSRLDARDDDGKHVHNRIGTTSE